LNVCRKFYSSILVQKSGEVNIKLMTKNIIIHETKILIYN